MVRTMQSLLAVLLIASAVAAAHAGEDVACIDARPNGEFVRRAITVTLKDGTRVDGVLSLAGYDAGSETISVDTVQGRTLDVDVAEVDRITFDRELYRPNIAAQGPYNETRVVEAEPFKEELSLDEIELNEGWLSLRGADCVAEQFTGGPGRGQVRELESIRFDRERSLAVVQGSLVEYETEMIAPGGGSFGFGKGG